MENFIFFATVFVVIYEKHLSLCIILSLET